MQDLKKRKLLRDACIRQLRFLQLYHPDRKSEITEYEQLIKELS